MLKPLRLSCWLVILSACTTCQDHLPAPTHLRAQCQERKMLWLLIARGTQCTRCCKPHKPRCRAPAWPKQAARMRKEGGLGCATCHALRRCAGGGAGASAGGWLPRRAAIPAATSSALGGCQRALTPRCLDARSGSAPSGAARSCPCSCSCCCCAAAAAASCALLTSTCPRNVPHGLLTMRPHGLIIVRAQRGR